MKSEIEVTQSCPTLSDPMDCGPPGSSIHGIFQARVLEWGAIALTLMEVSEEELKSLLMKVKKESEKFGLSPTFRKLRSWHPVPSLHGK